MGLLILDKLSKNLKETVENAYGKVDNNNILIKYDKEEEVYNVTFVMKIYESVDDKPFYQEGIKFQTKNLVKLFDQMYGQMKKKFENTEDN